MNTGVYCITSPSGKRYVGSASDFKRRFSAHRRDLVKGVHRSPLLQKAATKYGVENLKFEHIIYCDKKDLLMYEQLAIDALAAEYNICRVAGSRLGAKLSEEHKRAIAEVHKGKDISAAHRAAVSKAHKGAKRSDETKAKISAAAKTRIISQETREKMLASRASYYANKRNEVVK